MDDHYFDHITKRNLGFDCLSNGAHGVIANKIEA
jgi:hypothetical protein